MALLNWKAFRCDFNARFTSRSRPLQLRKVSFFYWIQKLLASILGEWKGVPVPVQNLPSPWLTCFNSAAVSAQSKGLVPRPLVFGCFLVRSHQGGIDRTIEGKQCRLYTVKLHSSFLIFFWVKSDQTISDFAAHVSYKTLFWINRLAWPSRDPTRRMDHVEDEDADPLEASAVWPRWEKRSLAPISQYNRESIM